MIVSGWIIMIAVVNYVIDPFGVFHSPWFTKSKSFNERVVKIDYLKEHKDRFNGYMFGSSTLGTTDPKYLDQEVDGGHFYNLTCSSSNLYDFKILLDYLVKEHYPIKHLWLQIDLTSIREFGKHANHAQKHHYLVTGQSVWQFYLEYLTIFPFEAMKAKIDLAIHDGNATVFDVNQSGMWFVHYKDQQRADDLDGYIARESSFHTNARRTRGKEKNFSRIIDTYHDIVDTCQKEGIDLKVVLPAYNHLRTDGFKIDDLLTFLASLASYHDVWYFATYNAVTNEDSNYYEINHYTSKVAQMMVAKVFGDSQSVQVPEDFGLHLDSKNLKKQLSTIKENMLFSDKKKRTIRAK